MAMYKMSVLAYKFDIGMLEFPSLGSDSFYVDDIYLGNIARTSKVMGLKVTSQRSTLQIVLLGMDCNLMANTLFTFSYVVTIYEDFSKGS